MLAVHCERVNELQTRGQRAYNGTMTISDPLLDILCCPVGRQPLRPLEKSRLKKLNEHIAAGKVLYVDSSPVDECPREALITRDDKVIYLVVDSIPVLLPDRGIGTAQFTDPI